MRRRVTRNAVVAPLLDYALSNADRKGIDQSYQDLQAAGGRSALATPSLPFPPAAQRRCLPS